MRRDPSAHALRAVYEGDPVSVAVEGGVKTKPAPSAGFVVELYDRDIFISWLELDQLRAPVARSRSQRRRLDVQKKGDADGNGE